MTLYVVQRHDTDSADTSPDPLSVWTDFDAAQAEYDSVVNHHRGLGLQELETVGVDPAEGAASRNAYARTVFKNMDESKTVIVLNTVQVDAGGSR